MKLRPALNGISRTLIDSHDRDSRHLKVFLRISALLFGALQAWSNRYAIYGDTVSYLDIGDAYFRGDWHNAINAYWSPLYSWILGIGMHIIHPRAEWEYSALHGINFLIYIMTLFAFELLLREMIRYSQLTSVRERSESGITLSEGGHYILGYICFIWCTAKWIPLSLGTPDMCVEALLFLAAGISVAIRNGSGNSIAFALLGLVLGLSYLAKAAMLVIALVFIAVSFFLVPDRSSRIHLSIITIAVFLSVTSPFIAAISYAKHHLTLGCAGSLNYAWYVNGELTTSPKQGVRLLAGSPGLPPIYEYARPGSGTFPLWYDPSYQQSGIKSTFRITRQISAIWRNTRRAYWLMAAELSFLFTGILIWIYMGREGFIGTFLGSVRRNWVILVPAIAGCGLYLAVLVSPRYLGGFAVLLLLGIFSGIRLRDNAESKRLLNGLGFVIMAVEWLLLSPMLLGYVKARGLRGYREDNTQTRIAACLYQKGLRSGDKVAVLGWGGDAFWARLLRVQIVAGTSTTEFDTAEPAVSSRVLTADLSPRCELVTKFASTGARLLVARNAATIVPGKGWQKILDTAYYVYKLPGDKAGSRE